MWLSLGKEKVGGKWENKNPRQVAVDMRLATLQHMVARGEFFRVGSGSYYLDKTASCIMPVSLTSPGLRKLLWRLGYVPKTGFTAAILESIVDHAALAPKRPYHRVAYMGKDALYIRASDNTMLRIKADKITEVPLGTDDVILIANDLASWPSLEELKPLIEEMRSRIGKTCTQIRPDLPLSHHLTTRWSTDSPLSGAGSPIVHCPFHVYLCGRPIFTVTHHPAGRGPGIRKINPPRTDARRLQERCGGKNEKSPGKGRWPHCRTNQ
jgi:hypothetical protein